MNSQKFTILPNVQRGQLSGDCCASIYKKFMYRGRTQKLGHSFKKNLDFQTIKSVKLYNCKMSDNIT